MDFKNTVIIMTSNIGSQWIFELGDKEDEMREKVMDIVHKNFKPEFLNRLDEDNHLPHFKTPRYYENRGYPVQDIAQTP